MLSVPNISNHPIPRPFSVFSPFSLSCTTSVKLPFVQILNLPRQCYCKSTSSESSIPHQNYGFEREHIIGDCVVFEDDIFEDPYLQTENNSKDDPKKKESKSKIFIGKKKSNEVGPQNLVPDQWREVQAELNITKKDRRKIAQELEFGRNVEKRKEGYVPLRNVSLEEYQAYKQAKLAQLKPRVLDNPSRFPTKNEDVGDEGQKDENSSERAAPKNPRWAVYGKGLEDVAEFFSSGNYEPGQRNSEGPRKLFSKEEKVFLNMKKPDLAAATSGKWQPVHTLSASGEFYLLDALLKHNADVNCVDKDGLTALHKAIIGKKQAVTNYLLRESANPFARDKEGASLLHYAVQTASSQAIKVLLLYNVDINLQDNDGWTPLHLAVQTRRTDVVRLLLIKGADKTIKNRDGLTPLDLCLYSGRDFRTYQLIKLLKQLP